MESSSDAAARSPFATSVSRSEAACRRSSEDWETGEPGNPSSVDLIDAKLAACVSNTEACERSVEAASDALVEPFAYTFSTAVDREDSEDWEEEIASDTEETVADAADFSPLAPAWALETAPCADPFALPSPSTSVAVESMSVTEEPTSDA